MISSRTLFLILMVCFSSGSMAFNSVPEEPELTIEEYYRTIFPKERPMVSTEHFAVDELVVLRVNGQLRVGLIKDVDQWHDGWHFKGWTYGVILLNFTEGKFEAHTYRSENVKHGQKTLFAAVYKVGSLKRDAKATYRDRFQKAFEVMVTQPFENDLALVKRQVEGGEKSDWFLAPTTSLTVSR